MYLRFARRRKDGKEHRYWSIVESRRCAGGRVVQRPILYLGEINDGQREAWCRQIEAFDEASGRHRQLALFPAERTVPDHAKGFGVQVRLDAMELHRPRQWGACWLACHLYEQLELDRFFAPLLPDSREGTSWQHILQTLVCYRLIDPGSEWRLHRQWFEQSAMADLLGEDCGLVEKNALYRCLDKLLPHKAGLFSHLQTRWQDLFAAKFDVLLYDLTSTYFESPPPDDETDKRRHGYSRDKRSDCVQVVIALIVTPEGFPLGYEVLAGNTADCTTLRDMLRKIEAQYGKANRVWVMDRGFQPRRCWPRCARPIRQFIPPKDNGPHRSRLAARVDIERGWTACANSHILSSGRTVGASSHVFPSRRYAFRLWLPARAIDRLFVPRDIGGQILDGWLPMSDRCLRLSDRCLRRGGPDWASL